MKFGYLSLVVLVTQTILRLGLAGGAGTAEEEKGLGKKNGGEKGAGSKLGPRDDGRAEGKRFEGNLRLELEAFRVASRLSTSFLKSIPRDFEKVYMESNGSAEGMYMSCVEGFLSLSRKGGNSPLIYVRTLVFKLENKYFMDLDEVGQPEREKVEVARISAGEAIHLFCLKATSLLYSKEETERLGERITRELRSLELEEDDEEDGEEGGRKVMSEAALYLLELLDMEMLSVDIDRALERRRGGLGGKRELEMERRRDEKRIESYRDWVKMVRIPLPESRLRDRLGRVHHPKAENKLGVPEHIQLKSDELRERLEKLGAEEAQLMGGAQRYVDFERRKYLEAAAKRNSLLSFKKSGEKEAPGRGEETRQEEERSLKCSCAAEEECSCKLINFYGQALGKPVSLKLEGDLFNTHGLFSRAANRMVELKHLKELVSGRRETGSSSGEGGGAHRGKRLHVPGHEIIIPLSSLSKLQLMTLEQLSGIEVDSRSQSSFLPKIKEINHEKSSKISESVPVEEEAKTSSLKKKKSSYNTNYN
ncbi:hypothetical protein HWI79_506 [Cryptosporidium felis]|nr:hypothetical protein HWI79_506 [Cryptosporidium felis]